MLIQSGFIEVLKPITESGRQSFSQTYKFVNDFEESLVKVIETEMPQK